MCICPDLALTCTLQCFNCSSYTDCNIQSLDLKRVRSWNESLFRACLGLVMFRCSGKNSRWLTLPVYMRLWSHGFPPPPKRTNLCHSEYAWLSKNLTGLFGPHFLTIGVSPSGFKLNLFAIALHEKYRGEQACLWVEEECEGEALHCHADKGFATVVGPLFVKLICGRFICLLTIG